MWKNNWITVMLNTMSNDIIEAQLSTYDNKSKPIILRYTAETITSR